jgi:hypothetical protein
MMLLCDSCVDFDDGCFRARSLSIQNFPFILLIFIIHNLNLLSRFQMFEAIFKMTMRTSNAVMGMTNEANRRLEATTERLSALAGATCASGGGLGGRGSCCGRLCVVL